VYDFAVAFPRALRLVRDSAALSEALPRVTDSAADPLVRDASGLLLDAIRASYGQKVTRATALRVPAFARAYKLYTGTISSFALVDYTPDGDRMARPFLANPSRLTTYTALMSRTVGDLIAHDTAYWRITARSWDGFPQSAELMPYEQVNTAPTDSFESQAVYELGQITYNGVPVPDRDVIRFDGDGTGGWLTTGVDAITTAAALEAAVLRSAEVPSPSFILKNTGADLPADQVDALLTAWETARSNRSTAYLNSTLETHELKGWSPNDLQLVEARNAAATMIGRLCNLDPIWVGAGVPGSSLTYTNRQDLYRQLVDLSLMPVMRAITDRLSGDDVTPRGHRVGFDTDTFLRASTTEMTDLIARLVPLNVLTPDQAASLLDLPTGGDA
jgi:hypothetical protein